jgi:hypothetical protein
MTIDTEYDLRCPKCGAQWPDDEALFMAFDTLPCPVGGTHELPDDPPLSAMERQSINDYEKLRRADGSHPWEEE